MGKITPLVATTTCSVAASWQSEAMWFSQPSECLESPGEGLAKPQPSATGVNLNDRFSAQPAPTKSRGGSHPPCNTWLNSGVC